MRVSRSETTWILPEERQLTKSDVLAIDELDHELAWLFVDPNTDQN